VGVEKESVTITFASSGELLVSALVVWKVYVRVVAESPDTKSL